MLIAALLFARAALKAQQAGGADVINARAAQDLLLQKSYTTEPGGVSEDDLWQVLVLAGMRDAAPAKWSGSIEVVNGELHRVQGYRFELPDRVLPQGGWEFTTQRNQIYMNSPIEGPKGEKPEIRILPKGLLIQGAGSDATSLILRTNQGPCTVAPMRFAFGEVHPCAEGGATIRRIPAQTDLSGTELRAHDFPDIAAGSDGALWAVWSSYHDRQEELNLRRYKDGKWTRLIPVPRAAADVWRPHVAVDETNRPWLIWSQQVKGNWDLYAMPWNDNAWGDLVRVTSDPLPDIEPAIARAPDGTIYIVWQSLADRHSHVRLKYLRKGRWSETVQVTNAAADDWMPAVAAGSDGRVWIAWDRYNDSFDVYARSYSAGDGLGPEMAIGATARYEVNASVAVDRQNRPWIAWEEGGDNWGKDLGAMAPHPIGAPLGGPRSVRAVCRDGGAWKAAPALPSSDALNSGNTSDSDPLLFVDPNGSVWMAWKRRYSHMTLPNPSGPSVSYRNSVHWETYLAHLAGDSWTEPIPLASSWTRKSTRMGLTATSQRLWAFWPSESREWAFSSRPHLSRVIAGSVTLPPAGAPPVLTAYSTASAPGNGAERAQVEAIRNHRVQAGGATLRIVRGDLHRHTELSQDVGGLDDGSLPEFYRYMIDAAAMDFGASTDHQGGGTGYWNFMTQKMADMYLFPQRFVTLYAYERNMGNPFGHRNILHITRNYSIVPFFQKIDPRFMLPDTPDGELLTFNSMSFGGAVANDTKLLYEELRKDGGIAIPHTSATDSMGTDWADNDPKIDKLVEIYQGARQNYEAKNAPRGIKDGEEAKALGGFQDAGLVWNAWKKGYRIGTIASSDHYSTHMSYAMVYTPAMTRQAIFDAIGKRHTYGATDNIVLEFWLGEHFMGDEFTASAPRTIRVKVRGTAAVSAVHIVRDAQYVYKVAPNRPDVDFEYRDVDTRAGAHWYYVRVEQSNGELAWSSPIWVNYR